MRKRTDDRDDVRWGIMIRWPDQENSWTWVLEDRGSPVAVTDRRKAKRLASIWTKGGEGLGRSVKVKRVPKELRDVG